MRIHVFRYLCVLSVVAALAVGTNLNAQQSCSPCAPVPNACGPVESPICGEPCYSCENFVQVPCFYGKLESVFWSLEGNDRSLIMRDARGQDQTAFTSNSVDRYVNGTPRVLLGLNLTGTIGIEGQYNGFHHWRNTATLHGDQDLFLPGPLGTAANDFFMADQMTVFSESDFHSAEFNVVKRTRSPHLVWLVGFRYFNIDEKFGINSIVDNRAPNWSSDFVASSGNNLYGAQIGAKWDRPIHDRFGLQAVGKAGLFSNSAKQSTWMGDDNNTYELRNASAAATKTAFAGELNLGGYIKISENVSITGGYNLLWIGDVARAADQLDFSYTTESGKKLATDTLFMHGANVGVEWNF